MHMKRFLLPWLYCDFENPSQREALKAQGPDQRGDQARKTFSSKISRDKFSKMTSWPASSPFPNVLITAHQAFLTYEAMAEIARGWRRSNSRSSQ